MTQKIELLIADLVDDLRRISSQQTEMLNARGDDTTREVKKKSEFRQLYTTYDELLDRAVFSSLLAADMEEFYEIAQEWLSVQDNLLEVTSLLLNESQSANKENVHKLVDLSRSLVRDAFASGAKTTKVVQAQRAAIARHSKPGGSREKQQYIREIWATGKYSSRDICAEEECAALGMSFSTARKALRGTPDPA